MSDAMEPFRIHIDDAVLEDLQARLELTRFPDQIDGTGWDGGTPVAYVRDLVEYWRDGYDLAAAAMSSR